MNIMHLTHSSLYLYLPQPLEKNPHDTTFLNACSLFYLEKVYQTLEELSEALVNREVDGILIDTYAGGTHKDLFSKPSIRVARIIDYQTAYGVVIGGHSMRLRHCFYGYMRSHQAEIFKWVEELVQPITVRIPWSCF